MEGKFGSEEQLERLEIRGIILYFTSYAEKYLARELVRLNKELEAEKIEIDELKTIEAKNKNQELISADDLQAMFELHFNRLVKIKDSIDNAASSFGEISNINYTIQFSIDLINQEINELKKELTDLSGLDN